MAVVNFDSFAQGTTIQSTDQVVGFTDTHAGGERKWPLSTIVNAVTNSVTNSISQSLSSSGGTFSIRRLADSLMNQNYVGAAITTNEEAIIWGNLDTYQIGHLWNCSTQTPREAVSLPFIDGADNSPLDNRHKVLNLKKEGKTIVKFYHTWLQSMALLSDGTVWVKAYAHSSASYCSGWSTAETTGINFRHPSAFYRITQWDWTNPALANKIVDIQILPVNGADSEGTFCCLDNQGDLHFWGHMNPMYGSSHRYKTPTNITKGNVKLQNNVREFQINGLNGYKSLQVITKNDELWGFGYNGYGQLGDNSVTARTGWVQAQYTTTMSGTTKIPVANAKQFVRQRTWCYLNLGYISTGATQNVLYVSGWSHDTQSVKSVASTDNVYTPATGGTSPLNDPIVEAVNNGRNDRSTMLFRTASGRIYSAGMSDWGDGGRMNGASANLGPTFVEVDVVHPVTGLKTKFGPTSGITPVSITTSEISNACATGIIANIGTAGYTTVKYLFIAGYRSLTNIDDFAESNYIFKPVMIPESVDEVLFGGDRTNHQFTYIRCSSGRVYGLGYSASCNLKQADGWVSMSIPIF